MWEKLLLILLWGSFASIAVAQKANEILVVAASENDASRLIDAIKPHYSGVITVVPTLPTELSKYDAVMIDRPNTDIREMWLDSLQQASLITYVLVGGAFYGEGANFRNWSDQDDDTTDNQFWNFIGDSSEMMTAMVIDLTRIRG